MTRTELKSVLTYSPRTGLFKWRADCGHRFAGLPAGCEAPPPECYVRIRIGPRYYKAHRLAWLYMYGRMPPELIDHIDGDPSNNRIRNLRLATLSESAQNRRKWSTGKNKFKGVFEVKSGYNKGKFEARLG